MATRDIDTKQRNNRRPAPKSKGAKPTRPPRQKSMEPKPKQQTPKTELEQDMSELKRYVYGFILLAIAAYLFLSVFFYYVHWFEDQDILESSSLFDAISGSLNGAILSNPCGPTGAMLGYYMVSLMFGVGAIAIPISLTLCGLNTFGLKWKALKKTTRLVTATLLTMILLSVSFGFAFGTSWDMFGSGLGGEYGIYFSELMSSIVGPIGTTIILILLWLIVIVYTNIGIISSVGKLLSRGFGYIFSSSKPRKKPNRAYNNNRPRQRISEEGEMPENPFKDDQEQEEIIPIPDFVEITEQDNTEQQTETETTQPEQIEIQPAQEQEQEIEILPAIEPQVAQTGSDIEMDDPELEIEGLDRINSASSEQVVTEEEKAPELGVVEAGAVPLGSTVNLDNGVVIDSIHKEGVVEDIDNSLYDPTRELSSYLRPPVELLEDHRNDVVVTAEEIKANKEKIKQTLESFGIKIDKTKATVGPTVTLYEIVPAAGVRISKIKNLEDDIALSLSALGIRIIAPIPGKGTIGIEVPNKDKKIVSMYSVVKSVKFQQSNFDIPIVLGKTIQDETFVVDLAKMPHLLVAGATGQGKSVGLNAIITSILYTKHPAELKFVLVDPKKVELTPYAKLEKHFMAKIADQEETIITDNQKVIQTLKSLCKEMDDRYTMLNNAQVRNIKDYNNKIKNRRLAPINGHKYLPYIVVVIDEFADLIMTAGKEIEIPIARIAQLGRAAGMHMVIATQRPTTNIITGMIKANFPARIAFRVTSMIDSRTILDQPGANQLIGRGDMLVSTGSDIIRVQCAFADTPEVERITEFISNQNGYTSAYELPEVDVESGEGGGGSSKNEAPTDPMFKQIAYFVVQNNAGSTSAIQRRFSIGYNRAGRITDQLESAGIVGRADGSKPREVLVSDVISLESILNGLGIK
ncbi:MAG: DNA translocase FtsK [Rikenellaceae bacterium]